MDAPSAAEAVARTTSQLAIRASRRSSRNVRDKLIGCDSGQ
jgi:hypothetical protein